MRTLQPARSTVNMIETRKREHSRKPDEQYDLIESCSPGPYLEMFARYARPGWSAWGNESSEEVEPKGKPLGYSGGAIESFRRSNRNERLEPVARRPTRILVDEYACGLVDRPTRSGVGLLYPAGQGLLEQGGATLRGRRPKANGGTGKNNATHCEGAHGAQRVTPPSGRRLTRRLSPPDLANRVPLRPGDRRHAPDHPLPIAPSSRAAIPRSDPGPATLSPPRRPLLPPPARRVCPHVLKLDTADPAGLDANQQQGALAAAAQVDLRDQLVPVRRRLAELEAAVACSAPLGDQFLESWPTMTPTLIAPSMRARKLIKSRS